VKRTLALIGLLVVGLLLLLDPDTGIVTAAVESTTSTDAVGAAPSSTATTGAPPVPETSTSSSTTTTEPRETSTTGTTDGTLNVLGEPYDSPFGSFQVEVVFEDGVMVAIITVEEPPDRRSQRINDSVIPIYTEEAISSQSADFDAISGATVTWASWGASLESALFEAGV
jgi:uncharacterized protein with FMN-binding domain